MNPIDYSQLPLRDIHLPDAIVWWPPAFGWWLVIAFAFAGCLLLWWRYSSRYRERAALKALRSIHAALESGDVPASCAQRISIVIRRFAMSMASAVPVAGLTGNEWLEFLDSKWERDDFVDGPGRVLIFGPYAPPERVSLDDVMAVNVLCMEWIRAQRPEDIA